MQHFDSNPTHIVCNLQQRLDQRAATDAQVWSAEKMQPVTMSRGVRIMGVRHCVHTWFGAWKAQVPNVSNDVQVSVAMELFRSPYLEDKFSAVVLVGELLVADNVITATHMPQFADLIDTSCISGYEVCDRFSQHVLKELLIVHRHEMMPIIGEWMRCESSWRARSALWALIPLAKDAIYEALILDGCEVVLSKAEDCCKLAVGSALRALARSSPGAVYDFLNEEHNLFRMSAHGLSRACVDNDEWKQFFRNKKKDIVRSRRSAQPPPATVEEGAPGASTAAAPLETEQVAVSLPVAAGVTVPMARQAMASGAIVLPSISELMGTRPTESGGSVPVSALIHSAAPQQETGLSAVDEETNVGPLPAEGATNDEAQGESRE